MAKDKKNKTDNKTKVKKTTVPNVNSTGAMNGAPMYSAGATGMGATQQHSTSSTSSSFSYTQQMGAPMTTNTITNTGTGKKAKKSKKNKNNDMLSQPNLSNLSPEQLNQLQLEEAIKESNNPSMKLKKLKHPLSWKSFLLNLLILVLLTLVIAFVWIALKVDNFNFVVVIKDLLNDSGIGPAFVGFFTKFGNWITGKGWTMALTFLM